MSAIEHYDHLLQQEDLSLDSKQVLVSEMIRNGIPICTAAQIDAYLHLLYAMEFGYLSVQEDAFFPQMDHFHPKQIIQMLRNGYDANSIYYLEEVYSENHLFDQEFSLLDVIEHLYAHGYRFSYQRLIPLLDLLWTAQWQHQSCLDQPMSNYPHIVQKLKTISHTKWCELLNSLSDSSYGLYYFQQWFGMNSLWLCYTSLRPELQHRMIECFPSTQWYIHHKDLANYQWAHEFSWWSLYQAEQTGIILPDFQEDACVF